MKEYINLSMQYKSRVLQLKRTIKCIRESGFNTSKYEKMLMSIMQRVYDTRNSGNFLVKGNLNSDYLKAITDLDDLIMHIESFNDYLGVLGFCNWLEGRLQGEIANKEKVSLYVNDMINNLERLANFRTLDDENEEYIISKVYKLAYDLIKYELAITGNSVLYEYVKSSGIHTSFMNELVYNEIKDNNLDKDNSLIKNKVYELHISIDGNDYFDLDLIRMVLVANTNDNIKKAADLSIGNMSKILIQSNENVINVSNKIGKIRRKLLSWKDSFKEEKHDLRVRGITLAVALSLIVGGGYGIEREIRSLATVGIYEVTTETYSTDTGRTEMNSDIKPVGGDPSSPEVVIDVYEPYSSKYSRLYNSYDVSDSSINFNTAKEYYEYGVENYGVVPESHTSHDFSTYGDSYTVVTKKDYEYQTIGFITLFYVGGLAVSYAIYLFLIFLIDFAICHDGVVDVNYNVLNILELIINFRDAKKNGDDIKKLQIELENEINKALDVINQNEEYRRKFNQLYESNKYLLGNPEELDRKIDEILNNQQVKEAKKLVKSK